MQHARCARLPAACIRHRGSRVAAIARILIRTNEPVTATAGIRIRAHHPTTATAGIRIRAHHPTTATSGIRICGNHPTAATASLLPVHHPALPCILLPSGDGRCHVRRRVG